VAALRARVERWIGPLRLVGFVAGLALLAVTVVAAVRNVELDALAWPPLAGAVVAAIAWWLGLVWLWSMLAAGRWSAAEAAFWTRTQVLRYLPGGFWAPASRVALTTGPAKRRLTLVGAENGIALCAALAVGGLALALGGHPAWAPLVLALALPPVGAARLPLGRGRARRGTVGALVAFVAYVGSAALVQGSVSGADASLEVAGAAGIAWAAGLVVVIAPGGLGVRELVFVALLHGELAHGELATGAVVTRVVTIVAELAVFVAIARPRGAGGAHDRGRDVGTEELRNRPGSCP
jgi:hypothetical protein